MRKPETEAEGNGRLLVADIGGTNTRIGSASNGCVDRNSIARFLNSDYNCFEDIVREFRRNAGSTEFCGICVAVAGPVEPDRARLTNIDWTVEAASLSDAAGCRNAVILNDLLAIGHGLNSADSNDVHAIYGAVESNSTVPMSHGKQLVVNVGTGFNTALVINAPSGRIVSDSECSRVTLPVRTGPELELRSEIERLNGYAGIEHVLSGRGVAATHNWVSRRRTTRPVRPGAEVNSDFRATPELEETGRILTGILGTVVGDLALHHLPSCGIFLVGGVVRGLAPHLKEFGFEASFLNKGDYREFMRRFTVSVVTDDYLALKGCAAHGLTST